MLPTLFTVPAEDKSYFVEQEIYDTSLWTTNKRLLESVPRASSENMLSVIFSEEIAFGVFITRKPEFKKIFFI
jgi:hypothetical protein